VRQLGHLLGYERDRSGRLANEGGGEPEEMRRQRSAGKHDQMAARRRPEEMRKPQNSVPMKVACDEGILEERVHVFFEM
jgi:hypothetical protein